MKGFGRLEFSVFVCGAALMIVEIAGSRIIAPYLGVSLYSWASIIAVILGSLSAGYWYGGRLSDRGPSEKTYFAVVLLCGASVVFIQALVPVAMYLGVPMGAKYGPLVASLILFSPASFLFGLVSPFAIRLKAKEVEKVGGVAGSLYAFSTIGSITGTLLAGFFLIPNFGIKATLLLTASLVMATGLMFLRSRMVFAFFAALLIIALWAPNMLFATKEPPLFQSDSEYYHIIVGDANSTRTLALDSDMQSAMHLGTNDYLYHYVRVFPFSLAFVPNPGKVLLVGMGGGTIGRYFLENTDASVDAIEIDPAVVEVAKKYFGFPEIPGRTRIFAQDARVFLNSDENSNYDIIFVDAYASRHSMPYHLTTVEAVERMKAKLKPGGVVAVNVISAAKGSRSGVFCAIVSTYSQVFPELYVFLTNPEKPEEVQNVVFFATDETKLDEEKLSELRAQFFPEGNGPGPYSGTIEPGLVLTDDRAPIESIVASSLDN